MKAHGKVVIVDHCTSTLRGTVERGRRGVGRSRANLALSTFFECAFCRNSTYLRVEVSSHRDFHVSASRALLHRPDLVPLKADEFSTRLQDLSVHHEWHFVAPCASGCCWTTLITLRPQTTTSMVQISTLSTWRWPISESQRWVVPIEIQWVLAKWRGQKDFTLTIKEGEQLALSLTNVETVGETCPWQLRAFEWAQSRFLDEETSGAFGYGKRWEWLSWVTERLYPLLSPRLGDQDESVCPSDVGLGISIDHQPFVPIAPKAMPKGA